MARDEPPPNFQNEDKQMDQVCKYLIALGYTVITYNNSDTYVCEISHTYLDRPIVFRSWNDLKIYVDGIRDSRTIHSDR